MFRPAKTSLQGRSIDILNVIRNNASYEYQNQIDEIHDVSDIPKVGDVIIGNPTLSNEFINALVNRIALVRAISAQFNNPYERLKKGYLEFGDSVEEIFVAIADVYAYSANLAHKRELKKYTPKAESAFHVTNWRVMYPVTVEKTALKRAFLSAEGLEEFITRIIDSVYTAAAYDEYLLFKYCIIKAVARGEINTVEIPEVSANGDLHDAAIAFRGTSNKLTFMNSSYNTAGVLNNTPKDKQVIFMDSEYNAAFDVDVLSSAFNMEKADYIGSLFLIDDFKTFDNARWEQIRQFGEAYSDTQSTGGSGAFVEEVSETELAAMTDVKALLMDEDWFQIYDELSEMQDQKIASGLQWNYFYHNWKIVSVSPFANAVAFIQHK